MLLYSVWCSVEHLCLTISMQVAKSIKTVLRPGQALISVKLDIKRIEALQLDISAYTVAEAILKTSKLKLKQQV